ncbi:MAG: SH3 domain-containing protein [Bacilli bacterium]
MNYLIYPLKIMNITQTYKNDFTHSRHTVGTPKDYPIDDNCGSPGPNGYFYCPCDNMIVKKIFGVGTTSTNVLWLESTTKVVTPTFNDYVTIMVAHIEDSELNKLSIGQIFSRKEAIALEGKDGLATGDHFHIVVGRGKINGTGLIKNSNGIYVLNTTGGSIKPEEAFFIDNDFTKIKSSNGLNFINLYSDNNTSDYYYTTNNLNVRVGPAVSYNSINIIPKNTRIKVIEFTNNWAKISNKEYISGNYLSKDIPNKYYETKNVTADLLNVRNNPNGQILKRLSPLPKGTTIAIVSEKGDWTKISENRWISSKFIN